MPSDDNYDKNGVVVKRRAIVSGEMLLSASPAFDQNGRPDLNFRFNGQGARRFADATVQNIGKRFAIVVDNRVISAPVIQSAITGGFGEITGNFTVESANNLAVMLKSGALPAKLTSSSSGRSARSWARTPSAPGRSRWRSAPRRSSSSSSSSTACSGCSRPSPW